MFAIIFKNTVICAFYNVKVLS